jgi:peptide/nickel transport system permease protein
MIEKNSKAERSRVAGQIRKRVARVTSNKSATIGVIILLPIVVLTIFSPILVPHDPLEQNAGNTFSDPNITHLLGTDNYGRDIFSRVLLGGRTSLLLGVSSVAIALGFGIPLGLISGYKGGIIDEVIMRLLDVVLSIPSLLMALLIVTALGSSLINAILAVGIVYIPRIARVVRGETLSVKNQEFVQAAQVRGESTLYIVFKEILPNIYPPIVVEGSIRIGFAILVGASLSFLGLGAQPPNPDWGFMISQARNYIWNTPWYLLGPSVAIVLTVVGLNTLGDGLRDIMDVPEAGDKQ